MSGPPPLPAPDRKLPVGVRVIGYIGAAAGAWNFIMAGIHALATGVYWSKAGAPTTTPPVAREGFAVVPFLGLIWLVSSLGLLSGREWGRKATIGCLHLTIAGFAAWTVGWWLWWPRRSIFIVPPLIIGAAMWGTPLVLGIRYLLKPGVREAFSKPPPD